MLAAAAVAAVVLATCPAQAPVAGAKRVVIVISADAKPYRVAEQAIRANLQKHGYQPDAILLGDLPDRFTAEMDKEPAAFVAVGTKAAAWLAGKVRPPVKLSYCMVAEAASLGLLGRANVHGISTNVPPADQFRLIAEALPKARSIGLLYNAKDSKGRLLLAGARDALPKDWRLEAVDVSKHRSVADAIEAMFAAGVDVVWTVPDASIYTVPTVRSLLLNALRRQKPVFGFSPAFVRAGALLGIGINPAHQGSQAAAIVEHMLRAPPTTAAQPTSAPASPKRVHPEPKFEIAVNLVVAKRLSIELPPGLVARATHVFKPEEGGP